MGMQASRARESTSLTPAIMKALRAMGAPALRQPASFRTGKGRSDLIVPLLCLEIKNKDGVVSPEQDGWLRRMRAEGVPAYVVRSVAAAQAAVTLTRKGYCPMANEALELDLSFLDELQPKASETPADVHGNPHLAAAAEQAQPMEALSLDDLVKQVQPETVLPPAEETLAEADSEADALLAQLGVSPAVAAAVEEVAQNIQDIATAEDRPVEEVFQEMAGAVTDTVSGSQLIAAGSASLQDIADVIGEIGTLHIKLAGVLRSYASGQDGKPAVEPTRRTRTRRASQNE